MEIKNAQYKKNAQGVLSSIECEINGVQWSVPNSKDNRHYEEILKQVEAGTLTIKDAE
tara:strand:- start:1455 stop:1628 length:174 start_codon:yes stop_codon:yes gene_type:complete